MSDFETLIEKIKKRAFPLEFSGHYVGNTWLQPKDSSPLKGSVNPNNRQPLIKAASSRQSLSDALDAAEKWQAANRNAQREERINLVLRFKQTLSDYEEVLVQCLTMEAGKPRWEAKADFAFSMAFLQQICDEADSFYAKILGAYHFNADKAEFKLSPVGISIAFLPFSTPISSFIKYASAALITGCPLIVCPSTHATLIGTVLGHLIQKSDLPYGSVQFLFGNFESFHKALSDKRVQAIIYTGSKEHCELIRRESRTIKSRVLILQSGGKNATLVHSSANIQNAVDCTLIGSLKTAGQLCSSNSRVFVHKNLLDSFCTALVDKIQQLKIGPTDNQPDSHTFMGPLYSQKALEKFLRFETMAHREAEKTLIWGKNLEAKSGGFFVSPGVHLIKEFDPSSSYQSNVLFCPNIAVYSYDVLADAIDKINATDAPYIVSIMGDEAVLRAHAQEFTAPNILFNLPTVAIESIPVLTGVNQAAQHRFNGPGFLALLSFPQLFRSAEAQQFTFPGSEVF